MNMRTERFLFLMSDTWGEPVLLGIKEVGRFRETGTRIAIGLQSVNSFQ